MKKMLLLNLLILSGFKLLAQNGFTSYPNTITGGHVRTSIAIDGANKWYGSTLKGAYKFDGVNWAVYNITNSSIPSNVVNDISFDASGNGWFATRAGLAKFDGTNWTTYNISNSGLPNDSTYCVFTESSNVWVGTKQGLAKFDGSIWTVYTTSNSGITNNYVTAINKDINGDLLVGTFTGFCIKTASSWINYTAENSYLVDAQINDIYVENSTTKWIETGYGLFKFENNVGIPLSSLFPDRQIIDPPVVKTISKGPQGGVLISGSYASSQGFLEIVGTQVYFYPFPTSVYLSNFHVFDNATNKIWFIRSSGSPINLFSFDFASLVGAILVPEPASMTSVDINHLDINQVRAGVLNRGDMHWNLANASYEVPKNSGRHAIFASSLWLGGLDNGGSLHQAAMTYRQTGNDYWPGPLDTIAGTIDSTTSVAYDSIWKLDRSEIDEFRTMFANGSVTTGTYTPAHNIINWPAHGTGAYTRNMAPFEDVNGDGIYNPLVDGDYPKIKGDQMCYWIFNDNLQAHTETGGAAFKVEIHASAYAYACDSINDSLKALNYTTFYDYEIYNRSAMNYHDVYVSLWQDGDLGAYDDDYVGCNPSGNYSFSYNGDTIDAGLSGVLGYGTNPPMISNVILNGPPAEPGDGIDNNNNGTVDEAGEKNLMTHVLNYNNSSDPIRGNPNNAVDFYNYMQSKWQDGTHAVYNGDGTGVGTPHNFMFDGVPGAAGWSEATLNNPFVDRRINMSCGPFNLNAAEHVNFNFAIVFTRDDNPTYSIGSLYNKNLADINKIKQWYANENFPSCDPALATGVDEIAVPLDNELKLYPNPGTDILYIEYKSESKDAMLEVYDVRGQLLKQAKINSSSKQSISINDFAPGLYLLKVSDVKNTSVQRFIKQ